MKLDKSSYEWALRSLEKVGDSDLFARPVELRVLQELGNTVVDRLAAYDVSSLNPGPSRRFIVPKDDLSYRTATQLDPLTSVILTALVYQYGEKLEVRRRKVEERTVFSYRFAPNADGQMYSTANSWNEFWARSRMRVGNYTHVVLVDIADFYNQIYHHSLENELIEAHLPRQAVRWLVSLCGSLTAKVSRGIPVGRRCPSCR